MTSSNAEGLLAGFIAAGGWYDETLFALENVPDMGMGAVALREIKESSPLFRVPNTCILSPYTSTLKDKLTDAEWQSLNSWSQLILVMLWEAARGSGSPWHWYLRSMPTQFATPMFWSESERLMLSGTEIEDRVGRAETEALFVDTLQPLIQARTDIFNQGDEFYTLDAFLIQGSRILSRSFNIPIASDDDQSETTSSSSSDEHEIVAMIPIADALNAASGCNNARLFNGDELTEPLSGNETNGFTMMSIKEIPAQAQIVADLFNTYAELPNSELLRKYGHVDALPLPQEVVLKLEQNDLLLGWHKGNPFDEVHIEGDRILHFAMLHRDNLNMDKRVDWWLEQGQEDSFSVSLSEGVEDAYYAFAHLLLSDTYWRKARKLSELPEAKPDVHTQALLARVLDDRMERYNSTLTDDIASIKLSNSEPRRAALLIRIGEMRGIMLAKAMCRQDDRDSVTKKTKTL